MANIISPRRRGGGAGGGAGTTSNNARYRLRRIILVAVTIVIAFYIFTLRLILHHHSKISKDSSNSENHYGPSSLKKSVFVKDEEEPPIVIAHAISLIKCSKGPSVTGFLDAAAVLRHSIHKNSVHYVLPKKNNATTSTTGGSSSAAEEESSQPPSRYSYKMYGIVHTSCAQHAKVLERLGYEILVRDHPVKKEDIQGEWLRKHIEAENCCGSAEFIKLYAYHLTNHPIAVHWDMDVAILQPLDDLYDVMIYPNTHPRNVAARKRIERQHPNEAWPETVDAFVTRDITSAQPWEKVTGVQGGFLVARPDVDVFDAYIKFIKEGNYIGGRGNGKGWAGKGYGGFQGAMAYQGVVAYYYDQLRPNTAVELNVCRWNQVAADVLWRGPDHYNEHHLQCREHPRTTLPDGKPDYKSNTHCEDCRNTPIEHVKTAHYTACKKPWECKIANPRVPRDKRQKYRLENLVNVTYCMDLVREWFHLRQEFEMALEVASNGVVKPSSRNGAYEDQYFMGYCRGSGGYIAMEPPPEDFDMKMMYGI